jgi:hypothetical protein
MNQKLKILIILLLVLGALFSFLLISTRMTIPFFYRLKAGGNYTIGTTRTFNPLNIQVDSIEVLDRNGFGIQPAPEYMADPFIVKEAGYYYIFFEQLSAKMNAPKGADIAVLKSKDLKNWEHLGVVLDEPFHLSYPNIFKWKNNWYMIPEAGASNELRLYESKNFPFDWKLKKSLMTHLKIYDTTLIIKDSLLYLMGVNDNKLRLFFSADLEGPWTEHPASPIREGYRNDVRPAGRPGIINDSLYYFIQDNTYGYGTGVIAYRVDSISSKVFRDKRIKQNPILFRFGSGWASKGIHQLSWVRLEDKSYFCVVDGNQSHELQWGFSWKNLPEFR